MLGEPSWEPYISEWQESFLSLLSDLNLFLQLPSRFASFSPTSTESPVQSPRIRQTCSIPHRIYVEKAGCVVGRRSIFCLYGLAVLICKIRALNLDCVITQILLKSILLVYSLSTILNIILSTSVCSKQLINSFCLLWMSSSARCGFCFLPTFFPVAPS